MGQFASFSDFFAMGGYAYYVWSGVGLSFVLLLGLVFWSRAQRKQAFDEINQQKTIEELRRKNQNSEMSL